jgi:hypothetical protein
MIVPQFWAEARIQYRSDKRQITVRRFGWSDASQEDAQANADARAKDAFQRVAAGEKIARREPKVSYNGAEGVPIREEILRRHGNTIITRNLYGAHCLNTPEVLFADVDFDWPTPSRLTCGMILLLVAGACWLGWSRDSFKTGLLSAILALFLGVLAAQFLHRLRMFAAGGAENRARKRIESFAAAHRDWRLRLYRTPAGFRVLALHRTFDPAEAAVGEFFEALGTDRVYARMCANQRCFRARVSPKPWRIGISRHLRPRPGVWPIKPEQMPMRREWIENYERSAASYSACRFEKEFGTGGVHDSALAVQRLHDELSRAGSGLPMA